MAYNDTVALLFGFGLGTAKYKNKKRSWYRYDRATKTKTFSVFFWYLTALEFNINRATKSETPP